MPTWLPFEWIVALRFMRDGLSQTLLIVVGVGVGMSVIVFMSAMLSGLQLNIIRRALNSMPQVSVIAPQDAARSLREGEGPRTALVQPRAQRLRSVDQWQKMVGIVRAVPGVSAASPVASGPAFAFRGDARKSVSIVGIEPDSYVRIVALPDKLVAGRLGLSSTDAVIGVELARQLGVAVGDKLTISTASGTTVPLTASGLLDFGNKVVNERNVYVALRTAQNLLNLAGGVTSIEVNGTDPFDAERMAQIVQARTGLDADSWIKTNAQFFSAIAAQTLTNRLIRVFVGVAVALGITSVLIVSVIQKSREIGILRAMGTSRGQVLRVFLIQGGLMGLAGSLLGAAVGWILLELWQSLARNADGTPMFAIDVDATLFIVAALGATAVGVLSASMPARRAARLDPVVAIRG